MKVLQALVIALALTAGAAGVAAKVLWAVSAWYEWPALAIAGICLMVLKCIDYDDSAREDRHLGDDSGG